MIKLYIIYVIYESINRIFYEICFMNMLSQAHKRHSIHLHWGKPNSNVYTMPFLDTSYMSKSV